MPGLLDARVKLLELGCLFEAFSSSTDCRGAAAAAVEGWREVVTGLFDDLQEKIEYIIINTCHCTNC